MNVNRVSDADSLAKLHLNEVISRKMSYLHLFFGGGQVWEGVCECQIHVLLQRLSVLTGFINEMDPTCELLHYKKHRKAGVLV